MSHPVYKLPLRFVLRLRLQKGGIFVGESNLYHVETVNYHSVLCKLFWYNMQVLCKLFLHSHYTPLFIQ